MKVISKGYICSSPPSNHTSPLCRSIHRTYESPEKLPPLISRTLADLAVQCHYRERRMIRVLKQYAQETFTSLIKATRFQKACELLQNTDMQVQKIMEEADYTNTILLYSTFQKNK